MFLGTVDRTDLEGQEVRVRFRDVRRLRGAPVDSVFADRSDCTYSLVAGKRYLIVPDRRSDGRLTVRQCDLTQPVENAQDTLEYCRGCRPRSACVSAGPRKETAGYASPRRPLNARGTDPDMHLGVARERRELH